MTVILEDYIIADTGLIEIRRPVNLTISTREAQRLVNGWLCLDVSMMLTSGEPTLVVGKVIRWQVPVFFTAPHVGRVGEVGNVTVNAQTGLIDKDPTNVKAMLCAAKKLSKTLPPFKPLELPPAYLEKYGHLLVTPAPRLKIQADGEVVTEIEQNSNASF